MGGEDPAQLRGRVGTLRDEPSGDDKQPLAARMTAPLQSYKS